MDKFIELQDTAPTTLFKYPIKSKKEDIIIPKIEDKDRYKEDYYSKILNKNRYILLYDEIDNLSADYIVAKLRAMDILDNAKPITIEINSPGGSVANGMSIINTIENIKSPVVTIISGQALSMAALISIVGDKRLIYENSYWMQHPTSDIVGDYIQYIKDRTKFLIEFEKRTEKLMHRRTKLTDLDIRKIRSGELWLNAKLCVKKGIVDKIIKNKPKKKIK